MEPISFCLTTDIALRIEGIRSNSGINRGHHRDEALDVRVVAKAGLDPHCCRSTDPHEVTGAGDFPRGAVEGDVHIGG
jgi:hypothetical protein